MANLFRNLVNADGIGLLDIYEKKDGRMHLDFNRIVPEPRTKEECDPKYYITEDDHVSKMEGKEWYNWYKWRKENWGCKWEAITLSVEDNEINFDSHTPPLSIMRKISEMLGDVDMTHIFYVYEFEFGDIWRNTLKNGRITKEEVSTFIWNENPNPCEYDDAGDYSDFIDIYEDDDDEVPPPLSEIE